MCIVVFIESILPESPDNLDNRITTAYNNYLTGATSIPATTNTNEYSKYLLIINNGLLLKYGDGNKTTAGSNKYLKYISLCKKWKT